MTRICLVCENRDFFGHIFFFVAFSAFYFVNLICSNQCQPESPRSEYFSSTLENFQKYSKYFKTDSKFISAKFTFCQILLFDIFVFKAHQPNQLYRLLACYCCSQLDYATWYYSAPSGWEMLIAQCLANSEKFQIFFRCKAS